MRLREIQKALGRDQDLSIDKIIKKYCGEKIGSGLYRDVYVLKDNPRYVMKIERVVTAGDFANVCEWRNYINFKDWKKFSKYLAPCHGINQNGTFLIQTRLTRTSASIKDFPKKIPNWFQDRKVQNFGWIKNQFVCCDYVKFHMGVEYAMDDAKWWVDED